MRVKDGSKSIICFLSKMCNTSVWLSSKHILRLGKKEKKVYPPNSILREHSLRQYRKDYLEGLRPRLLSPSDKRENSQQYWHKPGESCEGILSSF